VSLVNAHNKSGNTALHWAALNGHVEVLLLLLQHGADPSILNGAGHDALFEAELNEKQEAVEALLKEGGSLESGVGGGQGDGNDEVGEVDVQVGVEEVEEGAEDVSMGGVEDGGTSTAR
jgi:ankyrin repeat protein